MRSRAIAGPASGSAAPAQPKTSSPATSWVPLLAAPPNGTDGVLIDDGATDNWIGVNSVYAAATASDNNTISGNGSAGVLITGVGTSGNVVAGNDIGTDFFGQTSNPNDVGVEIAAGATSNLIGASGQDGADDALERNIISGNSFAGVWITGSGTDQNVVAGNFIGTDVTGASAIGNGSAFLTDAFGETYGGGVVIMSGASDNLIGTDGQSVDNAGEGNVISGNINDGVGILLAGTTGNIVAGNKIGTNAAGTAALANTNFGVGVLDGATLNVIGTSGDGSGDAAEGNLISGNAESGVSIAGNGTDDNVLAGNLIGTNVLGTSAIPNSSNNDEVGVFIGLGAASNRVGTNGDGVSDALERNVISGNMGYDGLIIQNGSDNVVAGNFIGTTADGMSALPNTGNGVEIKGGSQGNLIGTNGDGANDAAEAKRDLRKRRRRHRHLASGNLAKHHRRQ